MQHLIYSTCLVIAVIQCYRVTSAPMMPIHEPMIPIHEPMHEVNGTEPEVLHSMLNVDSNHSMTEGNWTDSNSHKNQPRPPSMGNSGMKKPSPSLQGIGQPRGPPSENRFGSFDPTEEIGGEQHKNGNQRFGENRPENSGDDNAEADEPSKSKSVEVLVKVVVDGQQDKKRMQFQRPY
ncbi:unnamed protein product [Didymodactylos carnosus]|uniref:Uncharacterized protein n=1 Tax=Didymodactylos carnosus TaxID=1234261 RepID=A0A814A0L6_9BILA|nr:unnamed protein product [Didymodactylos carnosus]CAF1016414.1 unnamed protein product [Didymodactylos carnosus]CAF3689439.1 unnamed protein product [Didymodactylos carnosus]CAF3785486.1 unnamed protein product [Didymodactylos carnosus]